MTLKVSENVCKFISLAYSLSDGIEKEVINFATNQERYRKQLDKTMAEVGASSEITVPLKEENKSLRVQLELARNQLDSALRKRPMYEKRIQLLEQQLHAISVLLNDADCVEIKGMNRDKLLSMTSLESAAVKNVAVDLHDYKVGRKSLIPSDFDDSSDDTLHNQLVRAASSVKTDSKGHKRQAAVCDADSGPQAKVPVNANHRESPQFSSLVNAPGKAVVHDSCELPKPFNSKYAGVSVKEMKSPDVPKDTNVFHSNDRREDTHYPGTIEPSAPSWKDHHDYVTKEAENQQRLYPVINSPVHDVVEGEATGTLYVATKPHSMIQKKEIKPGKCSICKKGIGFQKLFYRCQDCQIKCHEECRGLISSSCDNNSNKMTLGDFVCPDSAIKVPKFVVDCIKEIERRGLSFEGLYRMSGSMKDVKELRKYWREPAEICWAKISDVHVITSGIKCFLKNLSEPIITRQLHSRFLEAGKRNDLPQIYKLIDSLPFTNRHTLAFMVLHLRKVARVQENLMDFKGLARVLGPTLIGHGCLNPSNDKLYEETSLQPVLLEAFFGISDEFWNVILRTPQTAINQSLCNKECSLSDSPLLGHIDGVSAPKSKLPRKSQQQNSRAFMDKIGKKKLFDTPTLII